MKEYRFTAKCTVAGTILVLADNQVDAIAAYRSAIKKAKVSENDALNLRVCFYSSPEEHLATEYELIDITE